jgi:cytoskeletal protein CcmA (bactofilin family)
MLKSGSATIVSAGSRLVGEMLADEEIVLAGTFEGVLRTTRSLQVAATGCILGEVHADSVIVLGRVVGPITAVDRIELQAGANVEGDLAAQRVRIHDDVLFNGHCRITGPEAARRQYLVPAIVQVLGEEPDPQALESVERAAEGFLRDFGFEIEVRPEQAARGSQALRPIFRSRDALPYARLREQLRSVQVALQSATFPSPTPGRHLRAVGSTTSDSHAEPLQTTGADGARALVEAMGQLRDAALMLGPVIVTRFEAERGPRLAVRVREDSLPPETIAAGGAPDPGALLVSLQKAQTEVVRDLLASAMARPARPAAGA